LGVQKHFDVLAHFEENNYGVATARHNFPKMPIHVGFDKWPVDQYRGKVNFVFANPPCAAWSLAGHTRTKGTGKWREDPRKDCTARCLTLRKELRPEVYVTESVTQAWSNGREFFEPLMKEAADDGYSTTVLLHDAKWLGLPQERKRVFFVFHRIGFNVQAPNWSPPPVPLDFLPEEPVGSPMIEKPDYFTAKRLSKVKPGERLSKFFERTTPESRRKYRTDSTGGQITIGRPAFGHVRLPVDRPSGATVGYCIVHPTEHRFLSTEEIQLLSGFPPEFHFMPKGANARAAEIARGVCPTVAEWLARQVAASLENYKEVTSPTLTEVDLRSPPGTEGSSRDIVLGEQPEEKPVKQRQGAERIAAPVQLVMTSVLKMPKPKTGIGSGVFIKLLLDIEKWTTPEIVAAVREHYPTSKATAADVAYHRGEMRAAGRMVGTVKQVASGRKLVPYVKKVAA
jgi:site-specific DNA-cytosine methylase